MKIAIMQPYFFPYVGYYSLIKHSQKFLIFDKVQFIRHGWIDRNRILKPIEGWQYIQVPLLKHPREAQIKDIEIRNSEPWRDKLKAQLTHYKKRSPYYSQCMEVIDSALSIQTESIVELNEHILKTTCKYLNIDLDIATFSNLDLQIEDVQAPDEWALNISLAMGFETYINPPGGMDFFNREKYHDHGVDLIFLSNNMQKYSQMRTSFENGLSIIDLMMFNNVDNINLIIDDITLTK
ncbi:WbqC family protein [Pedobacter sp. JCM 36344]|uniref:WbqC family protein n=1 Tax=Pedobacter sp. JCM 36344 TaxID=3374280 RepID=UPI00397AD8DC